MNDEDLNESAESELAHYDEVAKAAARGKRSGLATVPNAAVGGVLLSW
jgi:hypothetical protein